MKGMLEKARTALRLGLPNIARAANYRTGVRLGLNPVRRLQAAVPKGPFFTSEPPLPPANAPEVASWRDSAELFSRLSVAVTDAPPDWLANPLNGQRVVGSDRAWWQIPDFDPAVGDIKVIWELSRMDWVLAFAQRVRKGDSDALSQLNAWLADWCSQNPPYRGPNWKCGQEASIRVMHLSMAALILGQVHSSAQSLRDLVHLHLKRIAPTLQYAVAQDNNHGTSEAAALFIGGSWLASCGETEGQLWARAGRRWLENRAARLIGIDGSFSQYSLNYHRVMLDTFCMAEVWRRHLGLPAFSTDWRARALAATQWLRHMINSFNGDGPNVGANDGARLLQLTNTDYRDYRPSVQLAMVLFSGQRAYAQPGRWDDGLQWLDISSPLEVSPAPGHHMADAGGFAMLRRNDAMAMLRYPRFRFRPSQCDALHLDLWVRGDNLLRDGGTYSYNTEQRWLDYFGGVASHNTVQFDSRDQMPRVSRFLLGSWLKTNQVIPLTEEDEFSSFGASYRDAKGATHLRSISIGEDTLRVVDEVDGFTSNAVLRWRLMPGDWHLERSPQGCRLTLGGDLTVSLGVSASVPVNRCELVQGWESRYYLEKTPIPVLEIEIQKAGALTTELHWTA